MNAPGRFAAISSACLLLLSACASGVVTEEPQVAVTDVEPDDDQRKTTEPTSKPTTNRTGKPQRREDKGDGRAGSPAGGHDEEPDGGSQPGAGGESGEGNEDDSSSAAYPAAGRYSYAQTGWEEFCQAGACERRDLPTTQIVASKVAGRSGGATTIVTEARPSDGRVTRTTLRFTDDLALITRVYVRVSYQGFTFENTYDPQPPVESLRFPMRVGDRWSGRWDARTSGNYSVAVEGRTRLTVGGGAVNAYRVVTATDFRGEFEGRADITLWIDPATKAIVKSVGQMRLRSAFGGYNTDFEINLRDAPGY